MARIVRVLATLYAILGISALLLGWATTQGWFGVTPESLGMVYALAMALPWIVVLRWLPDIGPIGLSAFIVLAIALNTTLMRIFAHLFDHGE